MTDYRELAAAELVKIRMANATLDARARAARANGDDSRATAMEAEVTETSFRVAGKYIALAELGPDVPAPAAAPDPGRE